MKIASFPAPLPRRARLAAALSLTAALALAGCGQTASPGASSPAPSPVSASPTTAASTGGASPTAELATYMFASQRLSLRHPKAWTAEATSRPAPGGTVESVQFRDAAGKVLFTVITNFTSYDVGTPVQRTVLESGDLPGLAGGGWTPALKYAFFAEVPAGGSGMGTVCTLKIVNEVPPDGPGTLRGLPPQTPPTPGVVPTGPEQYGPAWNGPYFLSFELGQDVERCGGVDAARAWWASAEGQQVKAAVTSLTAG